MRNNSKNTTIEISKERRAQLRILSDQLRWSYDALLEDMVTIYSQIKNRK